jgi:hypothetical protein
MGLKITSASSGGSNIEPGAWPAVCSGYVDLGTQTSNFSGEEKVAHKVMLLWDIAEQRVMVEGKSLPRRISGRYTASLHEKATFRKVIEGWLGRLKPEEVASFDLDALVGKPCLLNIACKDKPDGKSFASVSSVMPLPRGMTRPALEVDAVRFVLVNEDGTVNTDTTGVAEWMCKIIHESAEWKAAHGIQTERPKADNEVSQNTEVPF